MTSNLARQTPAERGMPNRFVEVPQAAGHIQSAVVGLPLNGDVPESKTPISDLLPQAAARS